MHIPNALLAVLSILPGTGILLAPQTAVQRPLTVDRLVPVELGVMSRCPDALACEAVFDQVRERVGAKIDLSLVYVAYLNSSEPEFGVTCMHGPQECVGNVQQLCVAKYSSKWWEFVQCQNRYGRYRVGDEDVAVECGEEIGIEWETSQAGICAVDSGEGVELLKKSATQGQALGIAKSCTVLINHHKVCVRDGTWQECEGGHGVDDFVRQIEEEFEFLNGRRDS
ncbi:hypothetical protein HMN09_01233000 [Mycena chlorophos]|uniref:Gamma interferon inducible lysosomal thiol reductase n=1 Tax=Mycena chlorophos TaxID=658473 RepID=A0A8H6VWA5_MYCCL|nr:hypothetical protein HMN09_01233000 [Mycena chlorophos]